MIYTVTLNPSIDWYAYTGSIVPGAIHRMEETGFFPGGKGINVSQLLTRLGVENTALGFAAGFTGEALRDLLHGQGVPEALTFLPAGVTRINLNLRSLEQGETAFNGSGPEIPKEALEALFGQVRGLRDGDTLVLSGSVPPTLPEDIYRELLTLVRDKDVYTAVDAAGTPLKEALKAKPKLVKPNLRELGDYFGAEITGMAGAKECARALQEEGAGSVAVSMGARGALLLTEDGRTFFCRSAAGEAVSTVGAGDSFLAGFLYGQRLHRRPEDALRWGVAAGAATAFSPGIASREAVFARLPQVGNVHPV